LEELRVFFADTLKAKKQNKKRGNVNKELINRQNKRTHMRKVLNFAVLIEQDEEGWFVAKAPDIPGCATQGKTEKEALERIREAIEVSVADEPIKPLKFISLKHVEITL
jgi:predicted RNase H-like HicB family nuclease